MAKQKQSRPDGYRPSMISVQGRTFPGALQGSNGFISYFEDRDTTRWICRWDEIKGAELHVLDDGWQMFPINTDPTIDESIPATSLFGDPILQEMSRRVHAVMFPEVAGWLIGCIVSINARSKKRGEAYDQGWQAFLDKRKPDTCPYPSGSSNAMEWVAGYYDANFEKS